MILLLALLALLATAAPTSASTVLTPQNFKQSVAQGVWFVEHFSPYCGHCRSFEPTWNQLVDHFGAMPDPGVHLAQVNCALNGDLCSENGVTGYPQMNLYRDGDLVQTYDADREFHLLVDFLQTHVRPEGSAQDVPTSTEPEAASPSPSPPADRLVVQTPRSDANPSGAVVPLDVQSFDAFLARGPAFIKFFAPWCGHCKKLAPVWTQLGRRMQHKLNVAEVDCEQHKALCTGQGVTGFPMMFYYAHGAKTEYTGGRSYDQLVAFADKASDPTMQTIDGSELERVVRDKPVVYLLLHDATDARVVDDVAKGSQLLLGAPPVYVSTAPDLARTYGHAAPALLAFKDGDAREPAAVFTPALGSGWSTTPGAPLYTWLHAHRFPSALELSKDVFQRVMDAPHRPLVVVVAAPRGRHGDDVPAQLGEIARAWRRRAHPGAESQRQVVFTWTDAGTWAKWLKDMYGVETGADPVVVVADHARLVYYDQDAAGGPIRLDAQSVASALDAVLAGSARAKHSRTALERGVHALNEGVLWLERAVPRHPYLTALVLLGFAGVLAMALRSAFRDVPVDWAAEQRYAKGDRLD